MIIALSVLLAWLAPKRATTLEAHDAATSPASLQPAPEGGG